MIHKLKTLGVALAAVMAFTAISASAASATNLFHSSVAHTTVTGTQVGEDVFTTTAGTVKCKKASYAGTTSVNATEATQTVTPTYSECTAFGFVGATIDVNACEYKFTVTGKNAGGNPIGSVQIVCPGATKYIEVTTTGVCDVKVFPQTRTGITYTNITPEVGKKHVHVHVAITGLHYEQTGTNPFNCIGGNGTKTNGTYNGQATVKAFDTTGNQVDSFVTAT